MRPNPCKIVSTFPKENVGGEEGAWAQCVPPGRPSMRQHFCRQIELTGSPAPACTRAGSSFCDCALTCLARSSSSDMPPKPQASAQASRRGSAFGKGTQRGAETTGAQASKQDEAADLIDALLSKKAQSPPKKIQADEPDSAESAFEKSSATDQRSPKASILSSTPRVTPSKRKMTSSVHATGSHPPAPDSSRK